MYVLVLLALHSYLTARRGSRADHGTASYVRGHKSEIPAAEPSDQDNRHVDNAERAAAALERELQAALKRSFCGRCGRTLIQVTSPTQSPNASAQLVRSSMLETLYEKQRHMYVEAIGSASRTAEEAEKRSLELMSELQEIRQQLKQRDDRIATLEHKLLLTYNAAKSIAAQAQELRLVTNQQRTSRSGCMKKLFLARVLILSAPIVNATTTNTRTEEVEQSAAAEKPQQKVTAIESNKERPSIRELRLGLDGPATTASTVTAYGMNHRMQLLYSCCF